MRPGAQVSDYLLPVLPPLQEAQQEIRAICRRWLVSPQSPLLKLSPRDLHSVLTALRTRLAKINHVTFLTR